MTATAVPRRGGLLWQRNFRLPCTGETISGAGNSMAGVGVPLLAVTVLHASTFAVAALTAAAGLAAQVLGAATALLFNAASFVVSAVCLLRIRPLASPPARAGPAGVWPGVTFVARDPYLRPLTLYAAAANLAYTGNLALVVVFGIRVVGLSSAAVGLLMAAGGAGSLLGALLAPRLARVFGTARALVLTTMGYGLAGLLIPLTGRGPRLACYLIGSVLIAGGLVVGNVIIGSFRQQYCPPSLLGRVTASMRFLGYGMVPLGALLAGALGTALGVRDALWIVQVIFAASGLLLLTPRIRAARDLPGYNMSASKAASSAGMSPANSGGASV